MTSAKADHALMQAADAVRVANQEYEAAGRVVREAQIAVTAATEAFKAARSRLHAAQNVLLAAAGGTEKDPQQLTDGALATSRPWCV